MPEKICLRIDLEAVLAKEFIFIKRRLGIKNNTEIIRMLIHQKYLELGGKPPF